jgi:hypothetical protein
VDLKAMKSAIVKRWNVLARASGLHASYRGQDLRDVTDRDIDVMAGYLTKQGAQNIAWEMAGASYKRAHPGSRTPAELLAEAVSGDTRAQVLWRDLEEGTRGRQMWAVSNGLRTLLDIPSPDQDAALLEPEAPSTALVDVPAPEWEEAYRRPGLVAALMSFVESGGTAFEVQRWLRQRGITSYLCPVADPPPEPFVRTVVPAPEGAPSWLVDLD